MKQKTKTLDLHNELRFGKHSGRLVSDVLNTNPYYLRWIENNTEYKLSKKVKSKLSKRNIK
jgi:hypothetical protein